MTKTCITVSLFQTLYMGLEVTSKTTETVRIPAKRMGATKRQVSCQYHPKIKQKSNWLHKNSTKAFCRLNWSSRSFGTDQVLFLWLTFSRLSGCESLALLTRPDSCHVLDILSKLLVAVHVHDGHDLSQADKGQAHCAIVVEEGQPVLTGAGGEYQTDGETKEAGSTCEKYKYSETRL